MADTQHLVVALAGVLLLGVAAQWLAWRVRLPSVVMLLTAGFLAGPVTHVLDPDAIFGRLLFPFVSLSVALILFEGGLNLRLSELREVGRVLWLLVTAGVALTWMLATLGAWLLLDLELPIALLLGAILVVSGPTVVSPLLRHIRPTGRVGPLARWEGIVIDPIGATLAVLVFEAVATNDSGEAVGTSSHTALDLAQTIGTGSLFALLGIVPLILLLRRYWIPDYLHSPVTLAVVVGGFAASNAVRHESGLLAVTLMGIALANQNVVSVRHITRFKEDLSILLLSMLFILLSARLQLEDFGALGWRSVVFVALLIIVVRPAVVFLSAWGSSLSRRERVFLAWLAPRGIVAAAVASIFAIRLGPAGAPLVPATFVVIVGTVLVYGLSTPWLARRLGLSIADPQGVLIVGAYAGARAIAQALRDQDVAVLLVDTNRGNVNTARLEGLTAHYGNVLAESALDELALGGIGRLLALTRNDEVNALAALHLAEVFDRRHAYQLAPREGTTSGVERSAGHLYGRILFAHELTFEALEKRFARGDIVKATPLTKEFDYAAFRVHYGEDALPLFTVEDGQLAVATPEESREPKPGQTLIALVQNEASTSGRSSEAR